MIDVKTETERIVIDAEIGAPRHTVWRALIEEEWIPEWWGDHTSFDALPRGHLTERWTDAEGRETGRIWGMWNKELLPVRWETVEVSVQDAYKIRRVYRKLARRKGSGSLCRLTVFVRQENVLRLLRFLGYCLE